MLLYLTNTEFMVYIVVTGSVTHAIRGRDLLRRYGYRAYIERNSAGLGRLGCGYGIVTFGDIDKIVELLKKNAVKIIEVNRKN